MEVYAPVVVVVDGLVVEKDEEEEEEEEDDDDEDCLPLDEDELFLDASYDETTGGRSSDDRYWWATPARYILYPTSIQSMYCTHLSSDSCVRVCTILLWYSS